MTPETVKIGSINDDYIGHIVSIPGEIEKIKINDGTVFINLVDSTGNIDVVVFENTAKGEKINGLEKGQNITVIGKVEFYKNGLEIVASSIEH